MRPWTLTDVICMLLLVFALGAGVIASLVGPFL